MPLKNLRILVVFQIPYDSNLPINSYLKYNDWEDEKDVVSALKKLNHEVFLLGLKSDINLLIKAIENLKPNLVFNLCETFNEQRKYEANITSVCELLNVPYTGASPFALHLCQDKAVQKKILSYDKIKTPSFIVVSKHQKKPLINNINYPAIVKPLNLEASEGISQKSYVTNSNLCYERIQFIQKKFKSDIIIEEYIEGTDVYIAMIGNKTPIIGEPIKLVSSKYPQKKHLIATYKTKWDTTYRKKWGIKTIVMKKSKLSHKIQKFCETIYFKLNLSGYARFDIRVDQKDECFFLEANPNPSIANNDDFSKSVRACGISYSEIIQKIIHASLQNKSS